MSLRVLAALYRPEEHAISNAYRQHLQFCRELVSRAGDGWSDPWVAAHYYTYGLHPDKYRVAVAARDALQLWELHRARIQQTRRYGSNRFAA